MKSLNQRRIKTFFSRSFIYIIYTLTALTACSLAFIVVLSFLSPAVSKESGADSSQSFLAANAAGELFNSLKSVLKENLSDSKSGAQQKPKDSNEVVVPEEDLQPPKNEPTAPPPEVQTPPEDIRPAETAPVEEPAPPQSPGPPAGPEDVRPGEKAPVQEPASPQPPGASGPPADLKAVETTPAKESAPPAPPGDLKPVEQAPAEEPAPPQPPGPPAPEPQPPGEPASPASQPAYESSLEIQSYMMPFIYESAMQRSPFEDPSIDRDKGVSAAVVEAVIVPKTPPEEHNLKEIRLKGIIWDTHSPKALFELPGNAGYYSLIKGDKIGKNGVIFEIRESEVVIVETLITGAESQEQVVKIKKIDRIGLTGK